MKGIPDRVLWAALDKQKPDADARAMSPEERAFYSPDGLARMLAESATADRDEEDMDEHDRLATAIATDGLGVDEEAPAPTPQRRPREGAAPPKKSWPPAPEEIDWNQ
jgi:hypothetical protein